MNKLDILNEKNLFFVTIGILFAFVFLGTDFFIASKCASISKNEAEHKKKLIQKEANFIFELEGTAKFLFRIAKITIILCFLTLSAGIAIEIFANKMDFASSLKTVISYFCLGAVLFTIPQIVASIAMMKNENFKKKHNT